MANHSAAKRGSPADPQAIAYALIDAIHAGSYSRAYALLRQIEREHITLSEEHAKEALVHATCCTLRLFRTTYETLFPNGTDATMSFCGGIELHQKNSSHIEGSLLLFAAAFDRPEHARYLLDRGYDANGVPPHTSSDAFPPQTVSITAVQFPFSPTGKELRLPFVLSDCSPLAVAILFGSVDVIDVFTERSDVQREENASVCRATAFVLNDPPDRHSGAVPEDQYSRAMQEMCVNAVFPSNILSSLAGCGREFPRFPLDAIADVCTPELFEQQLRSWPRSEEEVRAALKVLADGRPWINKQSAADTAQKLRHLASIFPELCGEAWSAGFFLTVLCRVGGQEEAFADCCLSLLGDTVDLTWALSVLPLMPDKALSALLHRLRGKRLVINVDAFGFSMSPMTLKLLLSSAEIEPSCFSSGLSALASKLLRKADMKLLRLPKVRALLCREPREALSDAVRRAKNISVRALLLSLDSAPESDEVRAARYARYGCCADLAKSLKENHAQEQGDSIFDLLQSI